MTMHEAADILELTEAIRVLACTPRGSRLTRLELEREAEALVAASAHGMEHGPKLSQEDQGLETD
jgi:hypothetical protein